MKYKRIISLVPSLTELLIDLGIGGRLVGRTRFCIHPADEVTDIPVIGGTKNPRIESILEKQPDYIVANSEENRKEDVEELLDAGLKVNITDINSIEDALITIHELGRDLELSDAAQKLVTEIQQVLDEKPEFEPVSAAHFIWKQPWMVAASKTYINQVMKDWGLKNVYGSESRYPETNLDQLKRLNPQLVLLSSEPYPFKEVHIREIQEQLPNTEIQLVNGEWFSWYGSRMLPSFKELTNWRKKLFSKT